MRRITRMDQLWGVLLLVWGAVVLLLTTLPGDVPLMRTIFDYLQHIRFGDVIGHVALFALLTGLVWAALAVWMRGHVALLPAMILTWAAGTVTEAYQYFLFTRNADISDLLANWLGVFIVGFVISYGLLLMAKRALAPVERGDTLHQE